jgi:hypothetical protein
MVPGADDTPVPGPVTMTGSVVAAALLVARGLGLAALLLRRAALVALAAAVVVVLVARGREVLEQTEAHRRFLSGEGNTLVG